jgi:multidrug efflux pump subunit AcrB
MKSIVTWFVDNHIAALLLMILIVVGGTSTFFKLDREFFPEQVINKISVSVVYPGAGPTEVEHQICKRIEEAVHDLDGIEELRSVAQEGFGEVTIEVESEHDSQRLLNEVKSRVDAITTFPTESERVRVTELRWKSFMIGLILSGDIGEIELKELGEQLREELAELPEADIVELQRPRDYQVAIEVSEQALRRYSMRFDEVSNAIRGSSLNLPAGKIRDANGDILVQTRGQAYVASDFENIVVRSRSDGTRLLVKDVATVIDGFVEYDIDTRFNGKPYLSLNVFMVNHPNITKSSQAVHKFVDRVNPSLPPGAKLHIWRDVAVPFNGRLGTLVKNGASGLLLVFIVLLLFLRPRLAFWVCAGIAVAFLGALWLLPLTGTSLNMISLFAFILILGIVVDDAIIVGESIHAHQTMGEQGPVGSIQGTHAVLKPVFFAVISTMLFFVPFLYLSDAAEPRSMGKVVLLALLFSLIESMFILPAHLAKMPPPKPPRGVFATLERLRLKIAVDLFEWLRGHYRRFLLTCMAWRGMTMALFLCSLLLTIGVLKGGWLTMSFFPRVPADFIFATATLPESAPYSQAYKIMERIEGAALDLSDKLNTDDKRWLKDIEAMSYSNQVRVTLALDEAKDRPFSAEEITRQWRELIGDLPGVRNFELRFTIIPRSKPIEFWLLGRDSDRLRATNDKLQRELASYPGVINVRSSLEEAQAEIELKLKPEAQTLNLTLADIARQVRRAFYGVEVQRIPRLREDVKVLVRYPRQARNYEESLRDMKIRTASGLEVPFETVAEINYVPGYRKIERQERKRVARISAELQPGFSAADIITGLQNDWFKNMTREYPDITVMLEGEQKANNRFVTDLIQWLGMSMLAIFGLMAIMFRSYWQPILVLSAIPFGYMGSIVGHMIMGRDISMFSLMGIIACAGVVVNDNVVLLDKVNKLRAAGYSPKRAIMAATQDRFRPIMLTSLTTFIGLLPIMLETSVQAQFLIPMVISLAFGVLLATFVTLVFVPLLYLTGEGIKTKNRNTLSTQELTTDP